MRIICTFVVCALFIVMCRPSVAAEKKGSGTATSDQIGRYQLIPGKYEYATNALGNPMTSDAMYKLDTLTGKLYLCYLTQSPQLTERGNIVRVRTCEDFEQAWEVFPQPAQPAMK